MTFQTFQDTALVCLNGHVVNNSSKTSPENNTKFCEKCGEENIAECPHCKEIIRGEIHYEGVANFDCTIVNPPLYCHNCGQPYPWTIRKFEALNEAIAEAQLDDADKKDFSESIKNVTSDNPKTKLSVMKINKIGAKISGSLWNDLICPILVEIASETAKKAMGL